MPSDPSTSAASLVDIYGEVPSLACQLKCQDSCRDVPLLSEEQQRLALPAAFDVCPKLSADGACTVHADRPLMCRLWGVTENMPCPHGCTPTRRVSMAEGHELVERAEQLGHGWVNV